MISTQVEAIVKPWKYVPLRLTNGNSLSLMADVAILMRHRIDDADSPFASPTWRDDLKGVSITVKGYDQTLCEDVAASHFYVFDADAERSEIVEGRRFADANVQNSLGQDKFEFENRAGQLRSASAFDYDRLDEIV